MNGTAEPEQRIRMLTTTAAATNTTTTAAAAAHFYLSLEHQSVSVLPANVKCERRNVEKNVAREKINDRPTELTFRVIHKLFEIRECVSARCANSLRSMSLLASRRMYRAQSHWLRPDRPLIGTHLKWHFLGQMFRRSLAVAQPKYHIIGTALSFSIALFRWHTAVAIDWSADDRSIDANTQIKSVGQSWRKLAHMKWVAGSDGSADWWHCDVQHSAGVPGSMRPTFAPSFWRNSCRIGFISGDFNWRRFGGCWLLICFLVLTATNASMRFSMIRKWREPQ